MSGWDRLNQPATGEDGLAGRLARMRRRADTLLAHLLDDDAEEARRGIGMAPGEHAEIPHQP